jgi:hypothetical protein
VGATNTQFEGREGAEGVVVKFCLQLEPLRLEHDECQPRID